MDGPNFKEPSIEWHALQAILLKISKPFDSGDPILNFLDSVLLQPYAINR